MSRAGTFTDNSAMEAINGWLKEELFNDFKIKEQMILLNVLKILLTSSIIQGLLILLII